MLWDLRYEKEGYSAEAAQRKGREVPEWFLDEPAVGRMDHFYGKAFNDLSTCRSFGMGLGPIPWDKIDEYGRKAGLTNDILKAFIDIIRLMDEAYLRHHKDEAGSNTGQTDENSEN